MDVEILSIGDELITGHTVNSNASFLASALVEAGIVPKRHIVAEDDPASLSQVLKEALLRKSWVITTGGLGPTCDDHTRQVIAELFKVPLRRYDAVYAKMKEAFGEISVLENQALLPEGALILPNEIGTASGFTMENEALFPGACLTALPGVPSEMKEMARTYFIPLIKEKLAVGKRLFVRALHFIKLCEIEVDPLLREIEKKYSGVSCGIYPKYGTLSVLVKSYATSEKEFAGIIDKPYQLLESTFKDYLFDAPSGQIIEALHHYLLKHAILLATAESCTGGALSARFISQSDASKYFRGSIVAYDNAVKEKMLQVTRKTLLDKGAVSCEVTEEMAKGAAENLGAECAIAISGILGPKGGTKEKPVGTICATIFLKNHPAHSWVMHLSGNREVILEKAVQNVLCELFVFLRKRIAN